MSEHQKTIQKQWMQSCRVLPTGTFYGIIPEPRWKYREDSCNRLPITLLTNEGYKRYKFITKLQTQVTENSTLASIARAEVTITRSSAITDRFDAPRRWKILLSHSWSFKITLMSRAYASYYYYYVNTSLSCTLFELFYAEQCRDIQWSLSWL